MIVRTAWAQDGEPAAVMTWRYPALADHPFPSGAINAVLASIYNHPNEALNTPYLFIARDLHYDQIGLVITDTEGVALDLDDINALYRLTADDRTEPGWRVDREWKRRTWSNFSGDTAAIEWPFRSVFPVDPLNQLLAALYDADVRPFIYPAYDRDDDDSELRQVGLLLAGTLDLAGDASENWRMIRDRYRTILDDDELHPAELPWGQREWSLA